jgi:RNA polymerase sigma-70 factor (ECF subfamily)
MDEKEAVIHLQNGDLAGLEFLVRQYQVRAVYAAFLIVQDRELAEDVVQSAFLKVAEKIHLFDDSRPFAPWFYRIVSNDAVKLAQVQGRLQSIEEDPDEDTLALAQYLIDDHPDPELQLAQKETSQQIQRAMQQLKPEQRAVVVMRYYLELSEKEMADKLDRPLSTVKWWLHTARKELSGLISPDGRDNGGGRLK